MSYLFVNKSSNSDSVWRTSQEDKANVNRHVQQGRQKVKYAAKERLKSDADQSRTSSKVLRWRINHSAPSRIKLFTNLDAGRIDPFGVYPIPEDLTMSSKAILDHGECSDKFGFFLTWPLRTFKSSCLSGSKLSISRADSLSSCPTHLAKHCAQP